MKFNWFSRENKKEAAIENTTPNITYYFKSLWRKLPKLLSVNLLAVLQFIPLLVIFFTYLWTETTPSVKDVLFPATYGIWNMEESPVRQILLMLSSCSVNLPFIPLWKWILMGVMVLVFALLFGWWNVGFTYLMRELVNGRPIFIFSDLKHAIKRNLKQGFWVGLIDFALLFILGYNIYNMMNGLMINNFFGDFLFVANIAVFIIYAVMRVYIYLMIITFDIKFTKAIKNALIFVMLGFGRNVLAILWLVVLAALNFVILLIYIPLGVILPVFYIVGIPMFTSVYAAYPVIKKYMIDEPAPATKDEEETDEDEQEASEEILGITAEELWDQYVKSAGMAADEEYKAVSFENETAALIAKGIKTAISSAHPLYTAGDKTLPRVGEYCVILNAKKQAVCIVQTTKVYVLPFHKITEEHAVLEGEGDKTLKTWKKSHKKAFTKEMEKIDLAFTDETKIVCEQFRLVHMPE